MGTDKRERQKAGRQARVAAAQEAQRKAATRRRLITIGSVVVVAALVIGLYALLSGGDRDEETVTATTIPTAPTDEPVGSVAGEPCVARVDPLPAGAPEVPITPGPPPTELVTEDLVVGDGAEVPAGAPATEVEVNYIGVACSTGAIFDSSYAREQTATFPLDGVISGWTQGIPGMKVGGQRLLAIPPEMAYGSTGRPNIAPDETLFFVVELVDVVEPA